MPTDPHHRHNGGPLSDDDRRKLWDHVRALEVLEEQEAEIRLDKKARKELAKADGFDTNILAVILKRRKIGEGETMKAGEMIRIYEEGLREQGALPLERTRQPAAPPRRTVEEIAEALHGEAAPDMPEKADKTVEEAARKLNDMARENGATITLTGGGHSVTFDGDNSIFDPF